MSEMKILCAGFGRTGTLSLRYAFEELGIPCYHNNDMEDWHYHKWCDLIEGKLDRDTFDYGEILHRPKGWCGCASGGSKWHNCGGQGRYEACCDFPVALFYKEMLEQWPDAKVVLTTRDVKSWMESMQRLLPIYKPFYDLFAGWGWGDFDCRMRLHHTLVAEAERKTGKKGNYWQVEEIAESWMHGHNEEVKAYMKSIGKEDQLLVYTVKQGWEPLCKFLGVEAPTTGFPRANSKLDVHKLFWIFLERLIKSERWRILFIFTVFIIFLYFFVRPSAFVDQIMEVF